VKCAENADLGRSCWDRGLITAELELGVRDEPIRTDREVAQTTELNQAAAGQAVKAVVNAILEGLLASEAVRVSGLGIFNVARGPHARGEIHEPGRASEIAASKAVRFHAGKAVKDASIAPPKAAPRKKSVPPKKSWCGSNVFAVREGRDRGKCFGPSSRRGERPKTRLLCEKGPRVRIHLPPAASLSQQ